MGGTNPYIEKADVQLPTKPFTVTFIHPDKTQQVVDVIPDKIPYGPTGLPGSILDIALANGIDIDHACGGVCACSRYSSRQQRSRHRSGAELANMGFLDA